MVLAPYSNACASLPNEILPYGMKITGCSPAALAYAAMDAEVFPVETQATRVAPSCTACDAPQVIPLSLKDPVGLKPWCLNPSASRPPYSAARRPGSSGVQPSLNVTTREKSSKKGMNPGKAPHPALTRGGVGGAAPPPQSFQLIGGLRRLAVHRFQQTAASRAIVEDLGNRKPRAAPLFDTG